MFYPYICGTRKCHISALQYFGFVLTFETKENLPHEQTLHVHYVEPGNWLGLYLSYNSIMQSLKTVPAFLLANDRN